MNGGTWDLDGGVVKSTSDPSPIPGMPSAQLQVNDALMWNNLERTDIVGWRDVPNSNTDVAWQLFY